MYEPIFRAPHPGEEPAILSVLEDSFNGRWPNLSITVSPLEHLRWKMSSPHVDLSHQTIMEIGGRIAGVNLRMWRPAVLFGERIDATSGGDSCVHPDYQGQGLYRPMRAYALEQANRFSLAINTSDNAAVMRTRDQSGSRPLANSVDQLFVPLRFREFLSVGARHARLPPAVRAIRLRALQIASRLRHLRVPSKGTVPTRAVSEFDERVDVFAEQAVKPFELAVRPTSEYLNWRYADRRAGPFRLTLAEEDGIIVGFMATKLEGGEGRIADLLALPGRVDVVSSLVEEAVSEFRATGASSVMAWMPRNHPYNLLLRSHGFISTRQTQVQIRAPEPGIAIDRLHDDDRAPVHLMQGVVDEV